TLRPMHEHLRRDCTHNTPDANHNRLVSPAKESVQATGEKALRWGCPSGELKPGACMMTATILAIDLGKYKSVACVYRSGCDRLNRPGEAVPQAWTPWRSVATHPTRPRAWNWSSGRRGRQVGGRTESLTPPSKPDWKGAYVQVWTVWTVLLSSLEEEEEEKEI